MLRLEKHPKLKALGYRLLLQVHDEFVLEGPKEHVQEARASKWLLEVHHTSTYMGRGQNPLVRKFKQTFHFCSVNMLLPLRLVAAPHQD